MRRPTREQLRKAGVLCVKLATGDYLGAVQDFSHNIAFISRITRMPWTRGPYDFLDSQKPFHGSFLSGTLFIVNLLGSRVSSSSHSIGIETVAAGVALRL